MERTEFRVCKWSRFCVATLTTVVALAALLIANPAGAGNAGMTVILAINDVYRLKGIADGGQGGMTRVRTLRRQLSSAHSDLLFLHAGDFLSPSFVGRSFEGRHMLDIMNLMDGDPLPGAFDGTMFVTFGNHEFDDSHCSKDGPLPDLVARSEFTWLASNLDFAGCEKLGGLVGNPNISASRIVESGGLRVGLYGLTMAAPNYAAIVTDPRAVSCRQTALLRNRGADIVVALTHLNWKTDLEILGYAPDGGAIPRDRRPCADTPDLVVGGHDHDSLALPSRDPKLFKADADAVSAWVITVSRDADGAVAVSGELRQLGGDVEPDPLIERIAGQWIARHEERVCMADCIGTSGSDLKSCLALVSDGRCLDTRIARTASLIETEEIRNRSFETGFGNWVADRVRETAGADIALLNAGGFRLNYDIAPGSIIERRHLAQMFPFANKLAVREVTGADLWQAMEHAIQRRGEGAWAHFSGMALEVHVTSGEQRLKRLSVRRRNGTVSAITPTSAETFSLASVSFVLADGDGHGFALCPGTSDVWACKAEIEETPEWPLTRPGDDLTGFVEQELRKVGFDPGLRLTVDRRLCESGQSGCLIDAW